MRVLLMAVLLGFVLGAVALAARPLLMGQGPCTGSGIIGMPLECDGTCDDQDPPVACARRNGKNDAGLRAYYCGCPGDHQDSCCKLVEVIQTGIFGTQGHCGNTPAGNCPGTGNCTRCGTGMPGSEYEAICGSCP